VAHRSGDQLIAGGAILTLIGVCIVLVKVFQIPGYWVPLIVGLGLLLMGLIRRLGAKDSRHEP
jgi:hypothetical protein